MRSARLAAALAAAVALAAAASPAPGAERVVRDAKGRAITFDVRASGVDVAGYARILRKAVHGDEIEGVVVTIVPASRVEAVCGQGEAAACYSSGGGGARIVVPATTPARVRHTLLHEYGHHLDDAVPNGGRAEPNGTPRWWAARGMSRRLRQGQVAVDYSRGWSRSIGEVFAEDYVQLHLKGGHEIGWLGSPGAAVLTALRRDLAAALAAGAGPADPGTGGIDPGTDPGTADPGAVDPGWDDPGWDDPGWGDPGWGDPYGGGRW